MRTNHRSTGYFAWVFIAFLCISPSLVSAGIVTDTLPGGMEMVPYSAQLEASDGIPPYSWSVASGYAEGSQVNSFEALGAAQGWHGDDVCWSVLIPFDFPFYGNNRRTLYINSNGTITFDGYFSQYWSDLDTFRQREMIAPLWRDLMTYDPDDLLIDVAPNEVTVRWAAHYYGGSTVNFSVYLKDNGEIRCKYGSGNANGGMIGVSAGDGQNYVTSDMSGSDSMENAADIVFTPVGRMPEGLSCLTSGVVTGTPALAGTNLVTFVVQDSVGDKATKELEIVIAPNPNTRPVIDATDPAQGVMSMGEGTNRSFFVTAHDPEAQPLIYRWTWNDAPVGGDFSHYTYTADWGDAGQYVLRCYVSDDLWASILYAQWTVTVLNDNDGDGMLNGLERDLNRNPNDPTDGGGPSTLMGVVRGSGVLIEGACMQLRGAGGVTYHQTLSDSAGMYSISGVEPGHYFVKVSANFYADEWYLGANHLSSAVTYQVPAARLIGGINFDLASGQSPALVEVTSDPAGAEIYLDYHPTGEITPATINVGEVGDWDWAGYRLASHVIALKKTGHPRPAPQTVSAVEAETVLSHFDLTSSATGAVSVVTTPNGAEVYVDYADAMEGVTPVVVSNLGPGSHTILLRKSGYLQPRPIVAWVSENEMTEVAIPLEPDTAESRMIAEVHSVPQGIQIYIDYLPSSQVTDAVVGLMDPASHANNLSASHTIWLSASHTILLRREGAPPMAPRYVPEGTNTVHQMVIHLSVDLAGSHDSNGDGIPDWLWEQHGFDPENPPDVNTISDASGMTYGDKLRAGLIPGNPNSRFEMGDMLVEGDPQIGQTITFVFDTVPGRRYVVQAREKLMESGWASISSVITATANQTVFSVQMPNGTENQFYRLIVLVP